MYHKSLFENWLKVPESLKTLYAQFLHLVTVLDKYLSNQHEFECDFERIPVTATAFDE